MSVTRIVGFGGVVSDASSGPWRGHETSAVPVATGKFITTASVQLAVTLNVPEVPSEGSQVRATSAVSSPGGGYVLAAAARAQDVESYVAAPLGTGPNSHSIRRRFSTVDIATVETALVGDVGVAITMVENDGKTASVVTPGVEAEPSRDILDRVPVAVGDLVHISGTDLVTDVGAQVLTEWAMSLPEEVTVVVSVSPAVDMVAGETWLPLLHRADVATMNIRESAMLTKVLGDVLGRTVAIQDALRPGGSWVRRTGQLGCEVREGPSFDKVVLPAFRAYPVDTSGVGDTHVAVMCASLLQGASLVEACRRANAAAAIEISHPTSFPLPTRAQVNAVLAGADPRGVHR